MQRITQLICALEAEAREVREAIAGQYAGEVKLWGERMPLITATNHLASLNARLDSLRNQAAEIGA